LFLFELPEISSMIMMMNFDVLSQGFIGLFLVVLVAKAAHNTSVIESKNPTISKRLRLPFLRFTSISVFICWLAFLYRIWTAPLEGIDSDLSRALLFIVVILVCASSVAYAQLLRNHSRSPDFEKNALIQEQLLLQSVSQTQRNLSLQRKVKDARRLNLKSQMNPHFLFNVLTGIQHLLMRNESEKASLVFSKFRRLLLLGFLSPDQVIGPLQQEIDQIEQYLELEDIRLEKKIKVQFEILADVHPKITPFPLFILQPLVENAIWHGLSSTTIAKPEIIIRIAWIDEGLEIKVQDNGIGMKKTTEVNSKEAHRSRGTAIVRERLSLLHHPGTVKIQETPHEHPFSSGITAHIRLPLWALEPAWSDYEQSRAS
jgi:signal transduction histidine kinase